MLSHPGVCAAEAAEPQRRWWGIVILRGRSGEMVLGADTIESTLLGKMI